MTVTYLTVRVTAGCFVPKKQQRRIFFMSLMSPWASSVVHLSVFCRKLWLDKNLAVRMKLRLTATLQDKKKLTRIEAQLNNNYLLLMFELHWMMRKIKSSRPPNLFLVKWCKRVAAKWKYSMASFCFSKNKNEKASKKISAF